jgi:hypothetical protein
MNEAKQIVFRGTGICAAVIALVLLSGCGPKKHSTEIYHANSEILNSTEAPASILMFVRADTRDYIDWITIDDLRIDHKKYGEVRVAPGSYRVEWERKFNISVMIDSSGSYTQRWHTDLTLEAGHIYTVHPKRTIGQGYRIYSWITDDTLTALVWGIKYVPGPYDFLVN